jgi:NIMA (never in mitosis gene a)-related kinase
MVMMDTDGVVIQVNEELHIRVGDFGLSRAIVKTTGTTMQSMEGVKGYTLYYAAPEIIMNSKFSFPADVYSFGIILYQLFTSKVTSDKVCRSLPIDV